MRIRVWLALAISALFVSIFAYALCSSPSSIGNRAASTPAIESKNEKEIVITYSSKILQSISSGYRVNTPRTGYAYLVVDMKVQNNGYKSFSIYRWRFSAVVNQVKYDSEYVPAINDDLPSVDVLNGGEVSGKIVFEIPNGASTFILQYEGYQDYPIINVHYNIRWIQTDAR